MAESNSDKDISVACPPRIPPNYEATPALLREVAKQIEATSRIAPLYETALYQCVIREHYSLQRNANLKCNWEKFKERLAGRIAVPFQFPNERDVHFYNCSMRFLPSLSEFRKISFRKSLKPGPGVDYGGQMVIPQELHMKRISSVKQEKPKKKNIKGKYKERGRP